MLRLVSVFSDGALLQQKAVTDFRGYAEKGTEIVGTLFQNNTPVRSARAIADEEGYFTLSLRGEEASFGTLRTELYRRSRSSRRHRRYNPVAQKGTGI